MTELVSGADFSGVEVGIEAATETAAEAGPASAAAATTCQCCTTDEQTTHNSTATALQHESLGCTQAVRRKRSYQNSPPGMQLYQCRILLLLSGSKALPRDMVSDRGLRSYILISTLTPN